jgi:hypothetical protein
VINAYVLDILTTPFITSGNSQGDIPYVSSMYFSSMSFLLIVFQILDSAYGETIARAKTEAPQLEIQPNEVLFIAILNNPNVAVRDAFKRWGDITRGVPTQVCAPWSNSNCMLMLIEHSRLWSE